MSALARMGQASRDVEKQTPRGELAAHMDSPMDAKLRPQGQTSAQAPTSYDSREYEIW